MGSAATAPSRRVLVIEDNPDSRESLRMILELRGHRVKVASDGREGVRTALAWAPDVAVVDIGLPLLDGYGVACQVRASLRDSIRLIALTAYSQDENRQRALESGFDFFMTKPADLDRLSELVGADT